MTTNDSSFGAGSAQWGSKIPLCAEVFEECDKDGGLTLLDEHAQNLSVLIMVS